MRFMTSHDDVIARARPYFIWMILFPLVCALCYIWGGIHAGLMAARRMPDTMIVSMGIILCAARRVIAGRMGQSWSLIVTGRV